MPVAICRFIAAFVSVGFWASTVQAQNSCLESVKLLMESEKTGQVQSVLDAFRVVDNFPSCSHEQKLRARSRASGIIASIAQKQLTKGDLINAQETIVKVPGLHWAVQAVRGDIAAQQGEREKAVEHYENAYEMIKDDQLTVQRPQLDKHAERLLQLTQ